MTGKQRIFVKELVTNPTQPLYVSAKKSGYRGNQNTLSNVASENLKKPIIMSALAKYTNRAEEVLIEVLEVSRERMHDQNLARSVDWATNARQTADSIVDRVHGKATQNVNTTTQAVVINIDLTQVSDIDG